MKILKDLKIKNNVLVLLKAKDEKIFKSARNLSKVKILIIGMLNVYDVIRYKWLVIDKEAIKLLNY